MPIQTNYRQTIVTVEDDILVVTINRPNALNALNNEVFLDVIQLFEKDIEPRSYKGVILTGAGDRAFVAGADIKEFLTLDSTSATALSRRGQEIFARIEAFPITVIAAVNGFALGGGCELAMACHLRVAGATAKFGQPEVNLGILPGYGGTQRLVHLIGKSKALELLLTGDMIDAQTALQLGLANVVCDVGEELNTAKQIIHKIATKGPLAIAETISAVNDVFNPTKNGYESEHLAFGRLAATTDFKEGVEAFLDKRKPKWTAQ